MKAGVLPSSLPSARAGWIVSPAFDLGLIAGPMLIPAAAALLIPSLGRAGAELPVWGWIVFVLLVDVAHVYSSLYRTYLDRAELARRPFLYSIAPVACLAGGILLYSSGGALAFWRVLAYLAVFHFVRQQFGFLALYDHAVPRVSGLDLRLNRWTIYAATLGPVVYWHTHMPRRFQWFVEGDFVDLSGLPIWPVTLAFCLGLYAAFAARQAYLWLRHRQFHPGRVSIVAATLTAWWTGIVLFDSDLVFTMTNTVAHGVPYVALVWVYVRRRWTGGIRDGLLPAVSRPAALPAFLGLLFLLAYVEEGLWDWLVWQEHAAIFGESGVSHAAASGWFWLVIPLLTVPQATHYVLDAFIWKMDGSNPGLREYLYGRAGETA